MTVSGISHPREREKETRGVGVMVKKARGEAREGRKEEGNVCVYNVSILCCGSNVQPSGGVAIAYTGSMC